ncbi:hypothetical protein A2524_00105 [Candidatus Wolfebacteria bacterium RIFOXYD12_FULL_48_21]|uniref:Uncharacterized protein n=1 Tax=Candidatus Wolfebacteria bacterium RIFOXYD1_FULL_48_65 TaxID=1802561 RepID=A0A1F8E543_9BACT|nr:MAG: hypothetical protein A2524_00105 [Candidatus Wolfebacteria bacterium RIFOXYD12_FULL_48_21]OGM95449.1 MAG: hypothetical protein A2610_00990 [Candidatus Wolfebacteria bacterium RIFOXYD1_FULL_48_65]OGM97134.1 MAG: hypothetical protein A2532_03100 [Candidatus Wolfebacteria bacterium RIFOXYD2_FULL_48_11]
MLRKEASKGRGVIPFAALFVEKGAVVPHRKSAPYSESKQCGMIGDPGEINPLHMSPTKLGDQGDESC